MIEWRASLTTNIQCIHYVDESIIGKQSCTDIFFECILNHKAPPIYLSTMEPAAKRRKLRSNSQSSSPPTLPERSTFTVPGATNEYEQVCIVDPNAPDRTVRLVALAKRFNIPVPYDRRYRDGVNANELCRRIGAVITPSVFSFLPPELVQEIQLHMPARSAQAMRIAVPGALEQRPGTIQWLKQFRAPLSNVGMHLFMDTDNDVILDTTAGSAPLIKFFNNDNARSALEYMLKEYPDFFVRPGDATVPGSAGQQFTYSFLPGQPNMFHTQPNLQFLHALRQQYSQKRRPHPQQQQGQGWSIVSFLAVRFPATPILSPQSGEVTSNSHKEVKKEPFDIDRPIMMHIYLYVDWNGWVVMVKEFPAPCTPGREDIVESLRQVHGPNVVQAIEQTLRIGNYEQALRTANPSLWQTGRYHPPPMLPEMYQPGFTLSLSHDNTDVANTQRLVTFLDRWTRQGYALVIPSGSIQNLENLFCFSKQQIASAFLRLISHLRIFRWNGMPDSEKTALLRMVMPSFTHGFNRWMEDRAHFAGYVKDLPIVALALLLVKDIYQIRDFDPQRSSFEDVMNLLMPAL